MATLAGDGIVLDWELLPPAMILATSLAIAWAVSTVLMRPRGISSREAFRLYFKAFFLSTLAFAGAIEAQLAYLKYQGIDATKISVYGVVFESLKATAILMLGTTAIAFAAYALGRGLAKLLVAGRHSEKALQD